MAVLDRRQLLSWLAGSAALSACNQQGVAPKKDEAADPLVSLSESGARPKVLRIGITPSRGAETHKLLEPLYRYLSSALEMDVSGVTAASYDALQQLMAAKEIELGVFSPLAYVQARERMDAVAMATATRNGSPTYLGYLVTKRPKDAETRPRVADLKDKTIAWVNETSTSGYLYPRDMLAGKGYDPDAFFSRETFAGDHESALRMVIDGEVEVAAAASPFVNPETRTTVEGATSLVVVAKTKRIPLDCVAIHASLQRELGKEVRSALLTLVHDKNETSAELSKSWGLDGFVKPMGYDEVDRIYKASKKA